MSLKKLFSFLGLMSLLFIVMPKANATMSNQDLIKNYKYVMSSVSQVLMATGVDQQKRLIQRMRTMLPNASFERDFDSAMYLALSLKQQQLNNVEIKGRVQRMFISRHSLTKFENEDLMDKMTNYRLMFSSFDAERIRISRLVGITTLPTPSVSQIDFDSIISQSLQASVDTFFVDEQITTVMNQMYDIERPYNYDSNNNVGGTSLHMSDSAEFFVDWAVEKGIDYVQAKVEAAVYGIVFDFIYEFVIGLIGNGALGSAVANFVAGMIAGFAAFVIGFVVGFVIGAILDWIFGDGEDSNEDEMQADLQNELIEKSGEWHAPGSNNGPFLPYGIMFKYNNYLSKVTNQMATYVPIARTYARYFPMR